MLVSNLVYACAEEFSQIGTVNYMSPEAIELPDGMRRLKVGRQSDIWSLGCILYQMVYSHPPFQHLSIYQKMKAIPDGSYMIDFPEYAVPMDRGDGSSPPRRLEHLKVRVPPHVIQTMKRCLVRNPKERATIPELLDENWLTMRERESSKVVCWEHANRVGSTSSCPGTAQDAASSAAQERRDNH